MENSIEWLFKIKIISIVQMVKTETHYIALYSQTFRENDKKSYALQPFPAQRIEFQIFLKYYSWGHNTEHDEDIKWSSRINEPFLRCPLFWNEARLEAFHLNCIVLWTHIALIKMTHKGFVLFIFTPTLRANTSINNIIFNNANTILNQGIPIANQWIK